MQVVILAGGKGTRLRPLTYTQPKTMVRVCGKPFLEHQLELVKSYGLTDVLILTGCLGKQIEDYFGDGTHFGLSIKYSYEDTPIGTGGALKNAEGLLDESFILLNGDTLLPIDYTQVVRQFRRSNKAGMIVAYSNVEKIAPNNLRIGTGDIVLAYDKQNENSMTHVDAGAIALRKEVLDMIPPCLACSLEEKVFPKLIERGELMAFRTDHLFCDMGTFEGLKKIELVLK